MGRVRTLRWGPRVIDLDLLLYGDEQIHTPGLTIPHPRLRERAFVLVPLAEIAPDLRLPGEGRNVETWRKLIEKNSGAKGTFDAWPSSKRSSGCPVPPCVRQEQ